MRESQPLKRIDLVSPSAIFVNRLPDMTAFRERFFRSCRTRIFQMLHRSVQVHDETFDVLPHDDYLTGTHSGQCLYGITEVAPIRGLSLVTISRDLLAAIVDDLFGAGDIRIDPGTEAGEISAMERRIGGKLIDTFAEALHDAFSPQLDLTPRVVRHESHTTLASVADAEELLCVMAGKLATVNGSGLVSIAIPYRGIEPYRVVLSSGLTPTSQTEANPEWSARLADVTDEIEIEVVIETGSVTIPLRSLQHLKVGDVLPLQVFKHARVISGDGFQLCQADVGAHEETVQFRLRQDGALR